MRQLNIFYHKISLKLMIGARFLVKAKNQFNDYGKKHTTRFS